MVKGVQGKMDDTTIIEYVAYYRVSTKKQGASRLGLEAQKATLSHFNIIDEFVEVQSGRKRDRRILNKALECCKKNDATLLVARLDRLSRNAAYSLAIFESGVKVHIADMPNLGLVAFATMAAVAQVEAENISKNTKAALKARAERGLSNDHTVNLTYKDRCKGARNAAKNRANSNRDKTKNIYDMIKMLKRQGLGNTKIATELNIAKFKTVTNRKFTKYSVAGLIKLHGAK